MRRGRKTAGMISVFVLMILAGPSSPGAEEAKRPSESLQLQETEILGSLKEALGAVKLGETEIIGSVDRPASTQGLPWSDPDPWPAEEPAGALKAPGELYRPLDRDEFGRLTRSDSTAESGATEGE